MDKFELHNIEVKRLKDKIEKLELDNAKLVNENRQLTEDLLKLKTDYSKKKKAE